MKPISLAVMALILAGTGTACGARSMSDSIAVNPYADVKHRAPPQPELKRNPHPTAYEFTVTLKDAPGPFTSVKGFMQYETKLNDPCLPDLGGMAGTRMRLKENVPFDLKKIDATTYRGVIYTNLFEDHDYFGLGRCHIGFIEARVDMNPDGASATTRFVGGIEPHQFSETSQLSVFFPRRHYGRSDMDGTAVPAMYEGTPFFARWKLEDLFSIQLSVRKLP